MNSFETISFTEVRDRAKARLRALNSTMQDMYIDLSILDANRRLMTKRNVVQKTSEPIDVCDYKAELPCDYKDYIAMATCPTTTNAMPFIYTNYPFDAPNTTTFDKRFRIEKGYILFPSNFDAEQVVLYYDAYDSDDDGFPILYLQHVDYYVFTVLMEYFESMGDFKSSSVWERKLWRYKNALIHNENVDNFRQTPPDALKRINVSLWYLNWYNNIYLQIFNKPKV
jgi:hypothetical protein